MPIVGVRRRGKVAVALFERAAHEARIGSEKFHMSHVTIDFRVSGTYRAMIQSVEHDQKLVQRRLSRDLPQVDAARRNLWAILGGVGSLARLAQPECEACLLVNFTLALLAQVIIR